jgi:hypothetical protein
VRSPKNITPANAYRKVDYSTTRGDTLGLSEWKCWGINEGGSLSQAASSSKRHWRVPLPWRVSDGHNPVIETSSVLHDEDFLGYGWPGILNCQGNLNVQLSWLLAHWSQFGVERIYDQFCALTIFPSVQLFSSGIGSFFAGVPYQNRERGIDEEYEQTTKFNPKFYCFTSFLFLILGAFFMAKGWWNAHYGDRAVWEGLAITGIGGLLVMASVLIFGFYCCPNP